VATELYYSGYEAEIRVYVNQRGDALASNFINGLLDRDKKKIVRLLQEFGDRGEIRNVQKFKLEEKPIYAFKAYQVRIPAFYLPGSPRRTIVLTHGFLKKADKMPPQEFQRALQIYNEVVNAPK